LVRTSVAAILVLLAFAARCPAQVAPPFFSGSATAFEPEVATAIGGSLLNARVSVSNDMKYVTVGAQPSFLGAPQLRSFSFAVAGSGLVGSDPTSSGAAGGAASTSILDRPGMTLVAPLTP
jgi:hypothetical protein